MASLNVPAGMQPVICTCKTKAVLESAHQFPLKSSVRIHQSEIVLIAEKLFAPAHYTDALYVQEHLDNYICTRAPRDGGLETMQGCQVSLRDGITTKDFVMGEVVGNWDLACRSLRQICEDLLLQEGPTKWLSQNFPLCRDDLTYIKGYCTACRLQKPLR